MAIVKSYIANTQKEAFDKVKMDLGDEAVIINTRKIRKRGFWGFFKKPAIELTVVVDEITTKFSGDRLNIKTQRDKEEIQTYLNETSKNEKLERMERQMNQVSDIINKVYHDVDTIKRKEFAQFDPDVQEILDRLIDNNISEVNAITIITEAQQIAKMDDIDLKSALIKVVHGYIGDACPIKLSDKQKKVIFFVGPTGVGKTTTLAKIAAIFTLQHNAKVGIITEDTYRIGAVEQLKIYADILGLPLDIIYSPEEIRTKLDDMENFDLILVDTAGKNTNDKEYHKTMKKMIEVCDEAEVYLVISATTGYKTAVDILESYSLLKDYKVLFTKLDECNKWGIMLDIKMITDKPLSYLTRGQNVAEDILVANAEFITNKLLGCEVYE